MSTTDCTTTEAGTIKIGRSTYEVVIMHWNDSGTTTTHLRGPRGAFYTLEETFTYGADGRPHDTGYRYATSVMSGAELRQGGKRVKFFQVGDILEYVGTFFF